MAAPSSPGPAGSSAEDAASGFDVAALASRYRGAARVHRLLTVAEKASGPLRRRALELAVDAIKSDTLNVEAYNRVYAMDGAADLGGTLYAFDAAWLDRSERTAAARRAALDKDIQLHTSSQIRENMRVR